MFTGIIEELGEVVATQVDGDSARLTIRGETVTAGAATAQGVNPATIAQGEKTTGKVYFDVTGDKPTTVVYNSGGRDLLVRVHAVSAGGDSSAIGRPRSVTVRCSPAVTRAAP